MEDLRDFQKIDLRPGQRRAVSFRITSRDLKFYNSDLGYDWEPGDFVIRIGADSSHLNSATVRWSKKNRCQPSTLRAILAGNGSRLSI